MQPMFIVTTIRAALWVAATFAIILAIGLPVWILTALLPFSESIIGAIRSLALFACFIVIPPAIAQRGGWRSKPMESLGCWLLFLGPFGWFVLYWWREAAEAKRRT